MKAQSFHQPFHPHFAQATSAEKDQAQNYGSLGRLTSSVQIGYEPGISIKEELLTLAPNQVAGLQITQSKHPMVLQAAFQAEDVERYHLLLTTKKGAFLENFPLQALTKIDCRHLRNGSYKIQLCTRDQATPLRQFKLVKY